MLIRLGRSVSSVEAQKKPSFQADPDMEADNSDASEHDQTGSDWWSDPLDN